MRMYLCFIIAILMDHYKIYPIGWLPSVGIVVGAFYAGLNDFKESQRK